jgi:drug/metabolite transporter (DMT)-like permease
VNGIVTILSVTTGVALATAGYLYARMSWDGGAPDRASWKWARAALLGAVAASLAWVLLKLTGSVHPHAIGSAVAVFGLVLGASGVVAGQLRRRRQLQSQQRSPSPR